MNFERLQYLNDKIQESKATPKDEHEYIELLYQNGNLTKKQFDNYHAGINNIDIFICAKAIGSLLLLLESLKNKLSE